MIEDYYYYSVHNLERHNYRNLYCYLPDNADNDLKNDIITALGKNYMGYKSLDYVKTKINKFNPTIKSEEHKYNLLLNDILDTVWQTTVELKQNLNSLKLKKRINCVELYFI